MTEQQDQLDLFSVPRARRTDPPTSHAAAASVRELTETQQGVLYCLRRSPGTDEEMIASYVECYERFGFPKASPAGLRSRRAELVRLNRVEDSGETRPTSCGRASVVWRPR